MAAVWSEKTKLALIAVDQAITDFVLKEWQSGSPEKISRLWAAFVELEAQDASNQGYGRRAWVQSLSRGFRDYPYYNGGSIDFLKSLSAGDSMARSEVYSDVGLLLNYFAPWEWESDTPKPRGFVGADGITKSAAVNKIRFRVLDEQASLDTKIAEAQAVAVKEKVGELAQSLGVDTSRSTGEVLSDIYQKNSLIILGGGAVLVAALGFAIFKGRG